MTDDADPTSAPPDLMTLKEVLIRLKGKIGRTNLLAHLKLAPFHGGAPTHRKNGNKILFTPADYACMMDSLAPQAVSHKPTPMPRRRSAEDRHAKSEYARALELLAK